MMTSNTDIPASSKPLDRLLGILEAVVNADKPVSVTDIATTCRLPVPTVHRQVAQLEERRLIKRSLGSKRLIVGDTLLKLSTATIASSLRADSAHQVLVSLAERTGEHCELGLRIDNGVAYIDSASSSISAQGLRFEQGQRSPLHCSSIGKLFLAELEQDEFEQWLAHAVLTEYTTNTIASPTQLRAAIRRVKHEQWAYSNEELVRGVVGCAVPVWDQSQRLVAGLAISAPAARVGFDELHRFRDFMNEASCLITSTFRS